MRICDLHADIGMDVLSKHRKGEKNVLRNHHIDKLKQGEIGWVGMACFFEGHETMDDFKAMIQTLRKEILDNPETLSLYTGGNPHETKLNAMITVEGMCPVQELIPSTIRWMHRQGVRVASLSWNDENTLSTGVKGNPSRGLTLQGQLAVKTMNHVGIIVDVSHASEKSFWDILRVSHAPVIATHSNARKLANAERNLSDQQIKAIAAQSGLIGLVAARHFISSEVDLQTADTLAKHARHIADIAGIDVLSIGFDYMDFLEGPFGTSAMASDLQTAAQSQNLIQALLDNGFSEEETGKIAWGNAASFFEKNLK